jgi:hypothetical protein
MAFTREQKKAWRSLPHVRERQREHQRRHRESHPYQPIFGPRWAKSWFVTPPKPSRLHPPTYRHGMRYTAEYSIWKGIIQRCENPHNSSYPRYGGGRGISVCREWRADFQAFFRDMGRRPSPRHVLIRIDKDIGYSSSNCTWATRLVEADNRRHRLTIWFGGEKHSLAFVARALGLSARRIEYERARGAGPMTAIKRAQWRKDHPGRSLTRKMKNSFETCWVLPQLRRRVLRTPQIFSAFF